MLGRFLFSVALLAAGVAWPQVGQDEGIGVADGKGAFYSVTNRRGSNGYFQVTKLSLSGAMQWNVAFDPRVDAQASAVAVDRDGNLIVAGTQMKDDRKLALVVKYAPSGALLWSRTQDAGGNAMPTSTAADADGNFYVAATVSDDQGSFVRVLRYNPVGAYFWGQNFRAGRSSYARGLSIDPSGDARATVEISYGDLSTGVQVKQVVFLTYGAVVPQ